MSLISSLGLCADEQQYGTFFLTRAAIPHIPKGGSIIVTASQVAYAGPPMLVDYSMTKGAQVAMVRCLSNQLLEKGIRVNVSLISTVIQSKAE